MSENRRDFIKTLGKLGAALGITAAASTVTPTKGATEKPILENRASLESTSNFANGGKPIAPKLASEMKKYEFKPRSTGATKQAQDAINELTSLRLDNAYAMHHPPRFISPHLQHLHVTARGQSMFAESVRITRKQMLLKELDPYNWGAVFELTWDDWKTRDPMHYTVEGRWEARVKPRYRELFGDRAIFYQCSTVPKELLYRHSLHAGRMNKGQTDEKSILDWNKDRGYAELTGKLHNAIQFIIDEHSE